MWIVYSKGNRNVNNSKIYAKKMSTLTQQCGIQIQIGKDHEVS